MQIGVNLRHASAVALTKQVDPVISQCLARRLHVGNDAGDRIARQVNASFLESGGALLDRSPILAARLLAEEDGPAARALELVVVTARLEHGFIDRLIQRALSRRKVSVAFVDPASFNGAARRPEPALLRLQAAGIAVAVIRADDDLAACLSGAPVTERAHA